ncbi:MAG: pyruvate, phosphate dikinase, partial [Actinobacteria bacterium]
PTKEFNTILSWADEIRRLDVRTNADTPEDAEKAREFGAQGIGLARTEHMFLGDRLPIVQKMILAEKDEERDEALAKLLEVQRKDFLGIYKAMDKLPVNIRLLDPPLHEFLPNLTDLKVELAKMEANGASEKELNEKRKLIHRVESMTEANPMLGLRGCRLGIVHPELYKMQVRAIIESALEWQGQGGEPHVEIMIPLVSVVSELELLRKQSEEVIQQVFGERGQEVDYKIGTMIELPRAAITSDEIARQADFFSYGTNDLTQTTFGFSRDDVEGSFVPKYLEDKILTANPFETLDQTGTGKLIEMSVELGRKENASIKLGVCGEHGGDPESVKFFHRIGLDYVSASPYRVPLARLAAAQAVIEEEENK